MYTIKSKIYKYYTNCAIKFLSSLVVASRDRPNVSILAPEIRLICYFRIIFFSPKRDLPNKIFC